MHAGHIALATFFMAKMIEQCLADPEPNQQACWADYTEAIFQHGGFKRGTGQAPELMRPDRHSPESLLTRLDAARERWTRLVLKADLIEQCQATRPHFAFGDLKPRDWTRLCAIHNAHHLRIVEDICRSLTDR